MFLLRSGLRFSFRALEVPELRVRKRSFSFAKLTFSSLSVRPLVASKIESNFRVGLNILCRSLPYHSNKRIALFTLSSFWSVAINSNVISINGAILSHCHLFGMLFILLLIFLLLSDLLTNTEVSITASSFSAQHSASRDLH